MEMKNGENILKILLRDKEYEITKNKDGKYSIPKEIKELLQISVSCINIDGNRVELGESENCDSIISANKKSCYRDWETDRKSVV